MSSIARMAIEISPADGLMPARGLLQRLSESRGEVMRWRVVALGQPPTAQLSQPYPQQAH